MAPKTKPWNICDSLLLFGLVASIITLICTSTLVWNPYLQTSSFYWGNCLVTNMTYSTDLQVCREQSEDHCMNPTLTLPPYLFTTTSTTALTTSSTTAVTTSSTTSSVTSEIASATETVWQSSGLKTSESTSDFTSIQSEIPTTSSSEHPLSNLHSIHRRRKRDSVEDCQAFICVRVTVLYRNPNVGTLAIARLWNKYSDLQYQGCSISSCDEDNEENVQIVSEFTQDMYKYYTNLEPFYCYLNYDNTSQVLYHINGSYSAAVSSIFWPIVALISFFVGFLMYRFRGCMNKPQRSDPPPQYDANYGISNPAHVTFVGVEDAAISVGEYAIGGSAIVEGGEKNPSTLGEEMGGSRPDATTPPPVSSALPPDYLEILPDGRYNFPTAMTPPAAPAPAPADDQLGAVPYDNFDKY